MPYKPNQYNTHKSKIWTAQIFSLIHVPRPLKFPCVLSLFVCFVLLLVHREFHCDETIASCLFLRPACCFVSLIWPHILPIKLLFI
jgi:hypothetical protein